MINGDRFFHVNIQLSVISNQRLKNYLPEIFDEIWQDVLKEVREDYPQYEFPDLWQFDCDIDTLLNKILKRSHSPHPPKKRITCSRASLSDDE